MTQQKGDQTATPRNTTKINPDALVSLQKNTNMNNEENKFPQEIRNLIVR